MAGKLYLLLALVTTLLLIPVPPPALGQSGTTARVIPDRLNVRLRPGLDAAVIGQFTRSTELHVTGRTAGGTWVFATPAAGGLSGWVHPDYLEFPAGFDLDSLPITEATGAVPPSSAAPTGAETGLLEGETAQNVNFRTGPDMLFPVIQLLPAGTPLALTGRTHNSRWLQATVGDQSGWLYARLVQVTGSPADLPVVASPALPAASAPTIPAGVVPTLGPRPRQIFLAGQALEEPNNPRVFSKVGDSITHVLDFLYQIGWGNYQLGEYAYLQPVIYRFITAEHNSFAYDTLAARAGWTSYNLLKPGGGDPAVCGTGETPLECEYRVSKPAIALIMIGTNDIAVGIDAASYRYNLERIVQISIEKGVVPVLSTLPDNLSSPEGTARVLEFNQIIAEVAAAYGIPLWDYWQAMQSLPNKGMGGDNYHPSVDLATGSAATFTPEGLQYGYTMRNLTALMVLDTVWRGAVY